MTADRGALVRAYTATKTFSLGNWPFFVFLLVLGGVLATFAWQTGNQLAAALLLGGFLVLPLPFWVLEKVLRSGVRVLAVYENGVLVQHGSEQFIAWHEFSSLRTWTVETEDLDVFRAPEFRTMELRLPSGPRVRLGGDEQGAELFDLIKRRSALPVKDEGRRRW